METPYANQTSIATTHRHQRVAISILTGLAALSSAVPAIAKDTPQASSSGDWLKPVWLTDLSLGVKESYDSNVYLMGVNPTPVNGYTTATKDKSSAVTTISPKIGVDFAKLVDHNSVLKTFALGYSPDFVLFHDATEETYAAHRVTTTIKAATDSVTLNLDNTYTYIDGGTNSLIGMFPSSQCQSAYTNAAIRERLNQWQDRSKISLKVDLGPAMFIRPTVSLLYYDLGANFSTAPGYMNFIDRYDLNGGADLGYNVTKTLAVTLGYRYGHQEQTLLPVTVDPTQRDASNTYQRVLVGAEGTPLKWLKLEACVGPEFISYTNDRPYRNGSAAAGLMDANPTDLYAEASVTATLSPADSLAFKYKRWDWVSSTGKNAYRDTCYDATYRHQFCDCLQLELGLKAQQSDYLPSSLRNDWFYTASAGLKYTVTKNLDLCLAYSYNRGLNDQAGIANQAAREFAENLTSFGATWKF